MAKSRTDRGEQKTELLRVREQSPPARIQFHSAPFLRQPHRSLTQAAQRAPDSYQCSCRKSDDRSVAPEFAQPGNADPVTKALELRSKQHSGARGAPAPRPCF